MKINVLVFILILFMLPSVSIFADSALVESVDSSSAPNWIKKAVGSYESEIFSGSLPWPGKTRIFLDDNGFLMGRYEFLENGTRVSGVLYNFSFFPPTGLKCTWKDSYGKGELEMTFNKYFTRFNGLWSLRGDSGRYKWDGVRL